MRLDSFIKLFTSIRLTVALLVLGMVLVFWGTLAQVQLGLYQAQNEFFRSFVVFWQPKGSALKIPVFPGGYLLGGLLLINLFAAHFRYYRSTKKTNRHPLDPSWHRAPARGPVPHRFSFVGKRYAYSDGFVRKLF